MITAAVYKAALVSLLIVTGASASGITYYSQQRMSDLNNHISNLNDQVSRENVQVNNVTDQAARLSDQIRNLQASNAQLNQQAQQLQAEVAQLNSLAQKQVTLISEGQILLVGNGAVAYVNFTVPSNGAIATLNVSFTGVEFGVTTRLSLLNPTQYYLLRTCNCVYYGNYSGIPTTWSSPWAHSYKAQVGIPAPGLWILAFQKESGTGSSQNFNEDIVLITGTASPLLTFLHGSVSSSASSGSVPTGIVFDTSYWNPEVPTPSSVVENQNLQNGSVVYHYQLYIVSGKTYTVSIYYRATNGYGFCSSRLNPFVPTGADIEQDFTC